ncbi:hypothetical protein ACTWQB_00505 [Piscibacillus sp. B03]|uniref:hypothetical protein n=1 Tax=Piscibacillus sp. B03 TaxID=3457430 RepID=UPI003FCCDDDA
MKRKKIVISILVMLALLLVWGLIYYNNSSLEKVVQDDFYDEPASILERVQVGDETFVIIDSGDYMNGGLYRKGFFGWKQEVGNAPIVKSFEQEGIRYDQYNVLNLDQSGVIYGFVNPDQVDHVRFTNEKFDLRHNVDTFYWYIVTPFSLSSFDPNQFSIIKKDGSEVFYPFE